MNSCTKLKKILLLLCSATGCLFPGFTSLARGKRMNRLILLAVGTLLSISGCSAVVVCNGTGETLNFEIQDLITMRQLPVEPCTSERILYVANPISVLFDRVRVFRQSLPITVKGFVVNGDVLVFDGMELYHTDSVPDMSEKQTILLCNESGEPAKILPSSGWLVSSDAWLIAAGETREFTTIRTGEYDFTVADIDADDPPLCTVELVDGNRVVWDGVELTCVADDPPGSTALIELRNDSQVPNDTVFVVLQGQEPGDLDALNPGDSRFDEYPTGAPLTFEAFAQDLVTLLDDCILNDPTDGDQVIWDGVELICVDQ